MSYVRPDDLDEEKKEESVPGAAPTSPPPGVQAPIAVQTTAPTPQTGQSQSKFVTFDRYLSANKDAATRQAQDVTKRLAAQGEGVRQDATKAATDITNRAAGANTAPVVDPASYTQGQGRNTGEDWYLQPGGPGYSEAKANVGQSYTGPTSDEVKSTFDALRSRATGASKDIGATKDAAGIQALTNQTGFDATLTNAAGARDFGDLRSKFAGLDTYLRDVETGASKAATDARTAFDERQAQYAKTVEAGDKAVEARKDQAAASATAMDKTDWNAGVANTALNTGNAPPVWDGRRPTGAEFVSLVDPTIRANGVPITYLQMLGVPDSGRKLIAATFDRLSPEEAKFAMSLNVRKDPNGFFNFMQQMATKYGVA